MSNKKLPDPRHLKRFNAIRPYIKNFGVSVSQVRAGNLTPYQKRKIKKYYDELDPFLKNPVKIYRPTGSNLKNAKKALHIKLKHIGAVPLDSPDPKARVKIDKQGNIILKHSLGEYTYFPFDPEKLALKPVEHVREIINKYDLKDIEHNNPQVYKIKCGKHLSKRSFRNLDGDFTGEDLYLAQTVARWEGDYANSGDWLYGFELHEFDSDLSQENYFEARKGGFKRKTHKDRTAHVDNVLKQKRRIK